MAAIELRNFTKKFATGIYPYSMMTSVYSPIEVGENPKTLKVSTSAQEWCGHVYTQLNLKGSEYHVEGRSYEEIAATLDLPLGTVKTYIHRARHELRRALEPLRE